MKAWDYDAVVHESEVYCVDCVPDGIDRAECSPIFASNEWTWPGATCDSCGETHDYMSILGNPPYWAWVLVEGAMDEEEYFADEDERDAWVKEQIEDLKECSSLVSSWEVRTADVTPGCSCGEFAGEESTLIDSYGV